MKEREREEEGRMMYVLFLFMHRARRVHIIYKFTFVHSSFY